MNYNIEVNSPTYGCDLQPMNKTVINLGTHHQNVKHKHLEQLCVLPLFILVATLHQPHGVPL